MDIKENNIALLRQKIEEEVGRQMQTPKDFDYLSDCVFEECHQKISPTTLKRLWGYLSEVATPRISTLNILSQFAGYQDWESFCLQMQPPIEQEEKPVEQAEKPVEQSEKPVEQSERLAEQKVMSGEKAVRPAFKWLPYAVVAVLLAVGGWWLAYSRTSEPNQYLLVQGQKFATYQDYLRLFGIENAATYWGCPLPHHPNIVVWGPEYHHPHWQNEGDRSQMMPTITEHWSPKEADSAMIVMRNRDKFNHEVRLNEVRITFMKNLLDSNYVFLGVYRLSLSQSDTTRCVWERVADECDLANLGYLEELRN